MAAVNCRATRPRAGLSLGFLGPQQGVVKGSRAVGSRATSSNARVLSILVQPKDAL